MAAQLISKASLRLRRTWKKIPLIFGDLRVLICLLTAWMITNGWSYIGFFLGNLFHWEVMRKISLAYMGFLWFPWTPEKIVTIAIATGLFKWLYPSRMEEFRHLINEINQEIL